MKNKFVGAALTAAVVATVLTPEAGAATLKYTEEFEKSPQRNVYLSGESRDEGTGEQREQSIGFYGVAKLVKENNPTLKVLRKQLVGIANTDVETQLAAQEIQYYITLQNASQNKAEAEASIEKLKLQLAGDPENTTVQTQLALAYAKLTGAETSIAAAQAGLAGIDDAIESAEHSVEDQLYSTRKQVENVANQIAVGAETAYLGIVTMEAQLSSLGRQLATLDRNLAVVERQVKIGAGSQLSLDNLNFSRRTLVSAQESLKRSITDTSSQLALLCGYDNDVVLKVSASPTVYKDDLEAMDFQADLAEAQKNSYNIWVKLNAARTTSNDIDDQKVSTFDYFEAAKMDVENAKASLENSFRTMYEAVKEKERLVDEAKAAYEMEDENFQITAVRYQRGMVSRNDYLAAQDELEAKKDELTTANRDLFSAFNTYDWARKGYMASS